MTQNQIDLNIDISENWASNQENMLGCLVKAPELVKKYVSKLQDDHFTHPYQAVFQIIKNDSTQKQNTDLVSLSSALRNQYPDLAKMLNERIRETITDSIISPESEAQSAFRILEEESKTYKTNQVLAKATKELADGESTDAGQARISEQLQEIRKTETISNDLEDAESRNMETLLIEHNQKLNAKGGLRLGIPQLDNRLTIASGELNIIQAMSNHGKTRFMLWLMYRILKGNQAARCVFLTYEASALRVAETFVNIISKDKRTLV